MIKNQHPLSGHHCHNNLYLSFHENHPSYPIFNRKSYHCPIYNLQNYGLPTVNHHQNVFVNGNQFVHRQQGNLLLSSNEYNIQPSVVFQHKTPLLNPNPIQEIWNPLHRRNPLLNSVYQPNTSFQQQTNPNPSLFLGQQPQPQPQPKLLKQQNLNFVYQQSPFFQQQTNPNPSLFLGQQPQPQPQPERLKQPILKNPVNQPNTSEEQQICCDDRILQCNQCKKRECRTKMFYKDKKKYIFCINCFERGMKGLHGSICHEYCNNNCTKKATWGYPEGRVLTCRTHKKEGMINVNVVNCHYICEQTKGRCSNIAEYGYPKIFKRIYCELHFDKMKMVRHRKRCNKRKRV